MSERTEKTEINPNEKRILQNIHLRGTMGKCGSLNKDQRLGILLGLMSKGFLKENMTLTKTGIEISAPNLKY